MLVEAFTVDFHGHTLYTTKVGDVIYVAMKPIVEGIGLDWRSQGRKITSNPAWVIPLQTTGGIQKMLCIPMEKLNAWRFSINSLKTKPCGETVYRDNLANRLINCGWQVETEKQISMGRIDIYATSKDRTLVIECKMSSKGTTNALGQLLFYKQDFPKAQLVLACQQRLLDKKARIFKNYKILVISGLNTIRLGEPNLTKSNPVV